MDDTLIIGLGNPDPALEDTYHNVGTLAMRWIAERAAESAIPIKFQEYKNSFSYVKIGNHIFIRPLVYMNESGRAVRDAMHTFGASTKDIIVIHDDSDIPVGEFKCATSGSSAGHKGIQSIIDHLHTEGFARIRIGIRKQNEVRRKKAGEFVLSPIAADDEKMFNAVFKNIARTIALKID